jgi:hypothetical protein
MPDDLVNASLAMSDLVDASLTMSDLVHASPAISDYLVHASPPMQRSHLATTGPGVAPCPVPLEPTALGTWSLVTLPPGPVCLVV